jgi:hypothetical protein
MKRTGSRAEDALVAIVPLDSKPRRLFPKDFLDDSVSWHSRRSLGLDHDAISDLRGHHSS